MTVSSIDLFNILREKLGETQAKALADYVEQKVAKKFEEEKNILATKEDIFNVRQEISQAKIDTIKWMVGFWLAQMAAIIGLYFKA